LREGVGGPLGGPAGLRAVTRRTLDGAMDLVGDTFGLTESKAETSAMSILSELMSAAMVDVNVAKVEAALLGRDSEESRGRLSVRVIGEPVLSLMGAERRLLLVDIVLILTDEGVLIVEEVPARCLIGVLKFGGLSVTLGSNILEESDTVDWTRERRGSGLRGLLLIFFDSGAELISGSSSRASINEFLRLRVMVTCLRGNREPLGLYFGRAVPPPLSRGLRPETVGTDAE